MQNSGNVTINLRLAKSETLKGITEIINVNRNSQNRTQYLKIKGPKIDVEFENEQKQTLKI